MQKEIIRILIAVLMVSFVPAVAVADTVEVLDVSPGAFINMTTYSRALP
jgi:hypothetical protein